MIKENVKNRIENEKLIQEKLPDIKDAIKVVGKKEMTDEIATDVTSKAEVFLRANFSGKVLKKMLEQLPKTIDNLQKNTRRGKK